MVNRTITNTIAANLRTMNLDIYTIPQMQLFLERKGVCALRKQDPLFQRRTLVRHPDPQSFYPMGIREVPPGLGGPQVFNLSFSPLLQNHG